MATHLTSVEDVHAFAHALYSGDKELTRRMAEPKSWELLGKELGLPLVESVLRTSCDTRALVLIANVLQDSVAHFFTEPQALEAFALNLLNLLDQQSSVWSAEAKSSLRRVMAQWIRKHFHIAGLRALPSQLCSTAKNIMEEGGPSPASISTLCLSLEFLNDLVRTMHGKGTKADSSHQIWVCHQMVRKQFNDHYLLPLVQLVVLGIQRFAARADLSTEDALLRLFVTLAHLFVAEEEEEKGMDMDLRSARSCSSSSPPRIAVVPVAVHLLLLEPALYERLWALQRRKLDQPSSAAARIPLSATLTSLLTAVLCFPKLRVSGAVAEAPHTRQQWLATTLLQSGLLLQRLTLRLPQQGSAAQPLNREEEDQLWRLVQLLRRIKPLYPLEDFLQQSNGLHHWLRGLTDLTRYVVLHPPNQLALQRCGLVEVWGGLATAAVTVTKDASRAPKEPGSAKNVQELCDHLDSFVDMYFQVRSHHLWGGHRVGEEEFENTISEFTSLVDILCSRRKCAVWKATTWQNTIEEIMNQLHVGQPGQLGTLAPHTVQRLEHEIWLQCAAVDVITNSGVHGRENAEALAHILFQSLSLQQRLFQRRETFSVGADAELLEVVYRGLFHFIEALLRLSVSQTQRKNDSVVSIMNGLIETEQEMSSNKANVTVNVVQLALTGIHAALQRETCEGVANVSPEVKQLAVELLEHLVFTPRTSLIVRETLANGFHSFALLGKGLPQDELQDMDLTTPAARYAYARCVAQYCLHDSIRALHSGGLMPKSSSVSLFTQLQQRLTRTFGPAGALISPYPSTSTIPEVLWLLCDARAVLSCCTTVELYGSVLDTLEPFISAVLQTTVRDGVSCVGEANILETLRLFHELVQNRQRRMNFEEPSVRTILLVRFIRDIITRMANTLLSNPASVTTSTMTLDWMNDVAELTLGMVENVLRGNFCNFGVFILYQDSALREMLTAAWRILVRLSLSDCVEVPRVGELYLSVVRELTRPFFDWFWEVAQPEELKHVLVVLDAFAFVAESAPLLEDSTRAEVALTALRGMAATLLPDSTAKCLPMTLRQADPSFLERCLSRSLDNLFHGAVASPEALRQSLSTSSVSGSAPALQISAQILAVVMKSPWINYREVASFIASQEILTGGGSVVESIQQDFDTLHDTLAAMPTSAFQSLGAPQTVPRGHPALVAVFQLITSLNQNAFHYY